MPSFSGKCPSATRDGTPLDGESDIVCAIIADIHHQGRGKRSAVTAALNSSNKVNALYEIGKSGNETRVDTLKARVKKWKDAGIRAPRRIVPTSMSSSSGRRPAALAPSPTPIAAPLRLR